MFSASTKAASGTVPATTDPQFNYVTMLLHGDGTNGAQNNTFIDSSTNNFTITRNGNTTQGSFSPYGSNWSNYFDGGTSTGLQTPTSTNLNLTGDFTIECWFNFTSTAGLYSVIWTCGNGLFGLESSIAYNYPVSDAFNFNVKGVNIVSSGAISLNTWYHIAVTRSSSTTRMFINGSIVATSTASYTITDATVYPNTIGNRVPSAPSANYPFYGYISNFRIVKGTAVYTSAFTPSTTPLTAISGTALLTCANNRFIDNSANNFTITANGTPSVQRFNPFGTSTAYSTSVIGGSGYFDGVTDYLSVPANTELSFGTGDFTVEAWFYIPSATGGAGSGQTMFSIGQYDTNGILFRSGYFQFGSMTADFSSYLKYGCWMHCAMSRSSGNFKIFIDGVTISNVTNNTSHSSANGVFIGTSTHAPASETLKGYISNQRFIKGTAVYTSDFTPPTSPVTSITNTCFLTNFTNGAIFDNAMMNDLETVGNAQISTSVVKYGTGSMSFDGTGDYLSTASTPNLSFGSGNFTIEAWVYANSLGSFNGVFSQWPDNGGSANNSYVLESVGSNMQFYWIEGTSLYGPATLGTITTGIWIHYAICRSGNTLYPFKNGVLGTTVSINQTLNSPTSAVTVGGQVAGSGYWNGYIDDLRITKGYARYTANFTPPTAAFLNTGPY